MGDVDQQPVERKHACLEPLSRHGGGTTLALAPLCMNRNGPHGVRKADDVAAADTSCLDAKACCSFRLNIRPGIARRDNALEREAEVKLRNISIREADETVD